MPALLAPISRFWLGVFLWRVFGAGASSCPALANFLRALENFLVSSIDEPFAFTMLPAPSLLSLVFLLRLLLLLLLLLFLLSHTQIRIYNWPVPPVILQVGLLVSSKFFVPLRGTCLMDPIRSYAVRSSIFRYNSFSFKAKNLDTSQELFDRFTYFVMYCVLCCIELVVNTPQDVQCMYDKLLVWHALYEKV